ncbi:MAG: site-specific integrase [Thermodesulfobacteriota bacterium]|jgi:integrase
MAILVECPQCRKRLSISRKKCQCGFKLAKHSGKVYWVSVYIDGRKKRERIGPNKEAAEQREREILKLRTEERFIDKDPAARLTLGELCEWYLKLPEVVAKRSHRRDMVSIDNLCRLLGKETKLNKITAGQCESYQKLRLAEESCIHPGEKIRPCTVNKEITCLKTMVNRGVRHGKLKENPMAGVKKLIENNVRMRILTKEEFEKLLSSCNFHLRPVVQMAYYMGLRLSEILFLTWPEVDLKKGFIRLSAKRTKTDSSRNIPIHPEVRMALEALPRGLHTDRVFLREGKPFDSVKHSFNTACRNAGIEDFTFHDLRHCALNNLRLAGNDFFQIMALSGHKTMDVFKRYNLVTEEELTQIRWAQAGR